MPLTVKATAASAIDRDGWKAARDTIDLASVATNLLGPAPGRRGGRGGLWWRCPLGTHEDRNPSFHVDPARRSWRCYGCGEHGDAAALVMRVKGVGFPEAKAILTGGPAPSGPSRAVQSPGRPPARSTARDGPSVKAAAPRPATPPSDGMTAEAAARLVDEAAARLWAPEGADALLYLHGRGLDDETIRAARLGWTDRADGFPWRPAGLVIPWFDRGRVAFLKIRPDDRWRNALPDGKRPPKYLAPKGWPPPSGAVYPGPEAIRPGRPVVITEGELDALLLAQELGDLASVVTLGSASMTRPCAVILGRLAVAPVWFVATDADDAGDQAAEAWNGYPRARRVRPPAPFKDWTEAATAAPDTIGTGLNPRRWWRDVLNGNPAPVTFTPDELARWRWGPAVDDPEPGVVVANRPADPR